MSAGRLFTVWPLLGAVVGFSLDCVVPVQGCIDNFPIGQIGSAFLGAIVGVVFARIDEACCPPRPILGSDDNLSLPKRPSFQFDLRRLFLVIAAVSLIASAFAIAREQRQQVIQANQQKSYRSHRMGLEMAVRSESISQAYYEQLLRELDDQYRQSAGYVPDYP